MRDKVLDFVEKNGPVLPTAISKALKLNSILAGAFLSSLTSSKILKVSDLKVGSSPLYYCPGQEDQLQKFSSNLNEKDFRTYLLLKEHIVLREDRCDALTRVSLDMIKDFATPLKVTFQGAEIKFWKWYLADENAVNAKVAELLGVVQPKPEVQEEQISQVAEQVPVVQVASEVESLPVQETAQTVKEPVQEKVQETVKVPEPNSQNEEGGYGILIEKIQKTEESQSKRIEELEKLVRNLVDQKTEPVSEKETEPFVDSVEEVAKHLKHLKSLLNQQDIKTQTDDELYKSLEKVAKKENFTINNFKIIRKGSEIDSVVDLNMFFGKYRFFLKIKSKKSANKKDLESVEEAANHLNLPGILLCTGDLSKKAQEYIKTSDVNFYQFK